MAADNKVLEINNRHKIPHKPFILKAERAGLKFSFGTNNSDGDFGKLEYRVRMKEVCGIAAPDMDMPFAKD